jgi:ABC-type nitrate/sulfonate/bicarbonate transport system substrate-binding protein
MGAEIAVRSGVGTLIIDARRGDGPAGAFNYTMATIATTDDFIEKRSSDAAGAVRAIVAAQKALKENVDVAAEVGAKLFPSEAEHIVTLVRRDLPYYQAKISREFVAGMNRFSRDLGILDEDVPYESIVATQFNDLWSQ